MSRLPASVQGWIFSPAYDINPIPNYAGLHLNISEDSNALDLDLARDIADNLGVYNTRSESIIKKVTKVSATGIRKPKNKYIPLRNLPNGIGVSYEMNTRAICENLEIKKGKDF